jgi:hypothetical protein
MSDQNNSSNEEVIPEVILSEEQAERAHQLKARWERPNQQLLVPITLTRYIIWLRDEFAYWKDQALKGAHETEAEHERLRAENEALRTGFFQLTSFAAQQLASVTQRVRQCATPAAGMTRPVRALAVGDAAALRRYIVEQLGFLNDDDNCPAERFIRLAVAKLRAPETTVTTGDSNARQASLAGNSADTSNVEPGNLSGAGRDEVSRGDRQQSVSHAERMFRSHPKASDLADLIRSRLFQTFLGQGFWHAHHVDLIWRYNGQDVREEADWLKDVWYVMRGAEKASEPQCICATTAEPLRLVDPQCPKHSTRRGDPT